MSSHVVVLDSTARRATIKTTPGKHLTDILQEACVKLGMNASQYGLKYKSKQLDLSLTFRLSGLASGAKLELVQLSRSPSIVTVALQLPESEAKGVPNGRLLDKFPSTTTLWLVLRKFEAGVAGGGPTRNLTARGVPVTSSDNGASGRLFYETPVVQILERELSTFTDLQKSLAQLGFNNGNVLVRLNFRRTDEPLEEAMIKIQDYFKSFDDVAPKKEEPLAPAEQIPIIDGSNELVPQPAPSSIPDQTQAAPVTSEQPPQTAPTFPLPSFESSTALNVSSRPVTIFSAPSSSTPQAARTAYNENDYEPSIGQVKAHQRQLTAASRPVRLPTDAEISAKAAAEEEKLAAVKEVDVKIRLPDQSQVVSRFGQQDTGKTLYSFVRSCLTEPFSREKFIISSSSAPTTAGLGGRKIQNVIPDSDGAFLIKDLGMVGRVLVNFSWDASASPAVHESRASLLIPELRSKAQEIKVQQPPDVMDTSADTQVGGREKPEEKPSSRKPGGVPRWLKLPGKK